MAAMRQPLSRGPPCPAAARPRPRARHLPPACVGPTDVCVNSMASFTFAALFGVETPQCGARRRFPTAVVRLRAGGVRFLLYVRSPVLGTIPMGSQRSREGYLVISSTKDGARGRRRTRAAITTAAALVAAAAFAGPASANLTVGADNAATGFPDFVADAIGTKALLCLGPAV